MRCSTLLGRTLFAVACALVALPFASANVAAKAPAKAVQQAPAKKTAETQEEVQTKLVSFAQEHVNRANKTLRPNRSTPEVRNEQGQYIARFLEVDTSSLTTELYPSNTHGCLYVGHVVYIEKVYECVSSSKKDAGKGPFVQTKSRRIRELTRYDQGKWNY